MDCSLPGSSVHGLLQARILELGIVDPGIELTSLLSLALTDEFFTSEPLGKL